MTASDVIRGAVAAAVESTHGAITTWSGPEVRPWSWHFRGATGGGPLLAKVPRWEGITTLESALAAGPQADTAAEFAALQEIHRTVVAFADPGLAAVVPVAYVAAVNAIVMDVLEAASLRRRLGVGAPGDAEAWFARLGRWLGGYHRVGGGNPMRFPLRSELERWETAERHHPGLTADLRLARTAAQRLEGRTVIGGIQHGDLTLGNVLVTGDGRVAVIDPNRTPGRWEADAARILTETSLGRSQLLTLGAMRSRATRERWGRALAEGHGGLDAEVLAYDRGAEAMGRRLALAAGPPGARLLGAAASGRFDGEITRRFGAA
jgi:hypothetical protein